MTPDDTNATNAGMNKDESVKHKDFDFDIAMYLDNEQRNEMQELERVGKLPKKINRSSDLFMKFLLGRKARTPLLLDLINSIFGVLGHPKLKTIELSNIEMGPDNYDKKLVRFDIRGVDENGRQLNVELQKESHSHFINLSKTRLCADRRRPVIIMERLYKE